MINGCRASNYALHSEHFVFALAETEISLSTGEEFLFLSINPPRATSGRLGFQINVEFNLPLFHKRWVSTRVPRLSRCH